MNVITVEYLYNHNRIYNFQNQRSNDGDSQLDITLAYINFFLNIFRAVMTQYCCPECFLDWNHYPEERVPLTESTVTYLWPRQSFKLKAVKWWACDPQVYFAQYINADLLRHVGRASQVFSCAVTMTKSSYGRNDEIYPKLNNFIPEWFIFSCHKKQ